MGEGDVVQRELKDSMDEVKYTNAEIQNEQKKQRELLIEISTDLKWIKKNGGKS